MTTTPTPAQLALSVGDVARGLSAEIPGMSHPPDPAAGEYATAHARRIGQRVSGDEPLLSSFAHITDGTGYTWFDDDSIISLFQRAYGGRWSFERFFSGLAFMAAELPALDADETAELEADGKALDEMSRGGWRPTEIARGGMVFVRDAGPDASGTDAEGAESVE